MVIKGIDTLEAAKFDDMFTRRKIESIHPSLRLFATAFQTSALVYLDLRFAFAVYLILNICSDNALNPAGAEAISPFLSNCTTLVTLRLNNTGVGPSGGEVCQYCSFVWHTAVTVCFWSAHQGLAHWESLDGSLCERPEHWPTLLPATVYSWP